MKESVKFVKHHTRLRAFIILSSCGFIFPRELFSQEQVLIRLIQADEIRYNRKLTGEVQILSGHVILEQDSTFLYCDSAYLNENENRVEAFGDIRIKASDTLNLYGNHLDYDGTTKVADMLQNVRLVDHETTLYTDHLIYDRLNRISQYIGGGRIINEDNDLCSDIGYYFTDSKEFLFEQNVVLINPDYTMKADKLRYNTVSRTAYFLSRTTIRSKDATIYCENGWYNTTNGISQYNKNAYIIHGEQTMTGDSLYYDQREGYGKALNHIVVTDTVQDIIIKGNYAEYWRKEGHSIITDSAVAVIIANSDSLYLHADTLQANFDTAQNATALAAFHRTRFFRNDIQGMCDSLYYNFNDSIINLYYEPVLWSEQNQLTADSISIFIKNKQIDRMILYNTSLIIAKDDTNKFNQIRGINMIGYFVDNDLTRITVESNAETIYYVREDDGSLTGINKAIAGNMIILLSNKKIHRIAYIDKPVETLYPPNDISPQDLLLKGFKWMESKRPSNKYEIFFR